MEIFVGEPRCTDRPLHVANQVKPNATAVQNALLTGLKVVLPNSHRGLCSSTEENAPGHRHPCHIHAWRGPTILFNY